jgi:hypothetical protein
LLRGVIQTPNIPNKSIHKERIGEGREIPFPVEPLPPPFKPLDFLEWNLSLELLFNASSITCCTVRLEKPFEGEENPTFSVSSLVTSLRAGN